MQMQKQKSFLKRSGHPLINAKKRKGKKEEDLSNFETVEIRTYKLEGEARYCPKCGFMKRPEKEPSLIRGSIAASSLVTGIMNAKYVNGMPLARQEREFARYDLDLSTKTIPVANWIINCADRYLKPLYQLMKEELLESRYIHCDESRIQVLGEPEQKGTTQNWMWVYLTDEFSGSPQMVLFDYERTRAGYHPVNFLRDGFHGYLTCDGYQAYHSLGEGIIVSGCLTHSITATTLLNHLKPCTYLTYILDELRKIGAFPKKEELKELLPGSEDLPEYCHTKLKNNTKPSDRESGRQPGTVSDGFYKMSIYE